MATSASGPTTVSELGAARGPVRIAGADRAVDLGVARGGALAAVAGSDGDVRLVDVATGRVRRTIATQSPAEALALDARGERLAVAGALGTSLFTTADGRPLPFDADTGVSVHDEAFAPDGDVLAAASEPEPESGSVTLWAVDGGRAGATFQQPNRIRALAVSPDGALLVGATEADTTVKVWDVRARRQARELFGHTADVTSTAFSRDGTLIATAGRDRTVRVWDTRRGLQLRVIAHDRPVGAVAFSPDGRRLVTGDDRGVLRVSDACSGCRDARTLLAIAARRSTRPLTAVERRSFLGAGG